jgi:hypothetical protein
MRRKLRCNFFAYRHDETATTPAAVKKRDCKKGNVARVGAVKSLNAFLKSLCMRPAGHSFQDRLQRFDVD